MIRVLFVSFQESWNEGWQWAGKSAMGLSIPPEEGVLSFLARLLL